MEHSNGSAAILDLPEQLPLLSQSLIRPLPGAPVLLGQRNAGGRLFTAGLNAQGEPDEQHRHVLLVVTGRGHWYRSDDPMDVLHNDRLCRGCGHHGHFDYILDYQPCGRPATGQDVVSALLGRQAVAA